MLTSRRNFLGILAGAIAAPIVVRSGLLMPVRWYAELTVAKPVDAWMVSEMYEGVDGKAIMRLVKAYHEAALSVQLPSVPPPRSLITFVYDGMQGNPVSKMTINATVEMSMRDLIRYSPGDMVNFEEKTGRMIMVEAMPRVPHEYT